MIIISSEQALLPTVNHGMFWYSVAVMGRNQDAYGCNKMVLRDYRSFLRL